MDHPLKQRAEKIKNLRQKGLGLQSIGNIFNISRERVRQILLNKPIRAKTREEILKRDNKKCQKCDEIKKLHIHHIDEDRHNNVEKNLITLCAKCHYGTHRHKTTEQKYDYIRTNIKLTPELHQKLRIKVASKNSTIQEAIVRLIEKFLKS